MFLVYIKSNFLLDEIQYTHARGDNQIDKYVSVHAQLHTTTHRQTIPVGVPRSYFKKCILLAVLKIFFIWDLFKKKENIKKTNIFFIVFLQFSEF